MTIGRFTGEYRFLSNFSFSPVSIRLSPEPGDTAVAITVEHGFQACKTLHRDERLRVLACGTPGKAKRAGRSVTLRPGWAELRLDVMPKLLAQKFTFESGRAQALLATGDAELVEGNDWNDQFWGRCNGVGQNHLGRLLMELRAELQGQAASL